MRIAKVAMTNTSPSSGPRRFSHVRARFEPEIAGLEFISAIILSVVVSEPGAVATGTETQLECAIPSLSLGGFGNEVTSNTDPAEGAAEPGFRWRPDCRA